MFRLPVDIYTKPRLISKDVAELTEYDIANEFIDHRYWYVIVDTKLYVFNALYGDVDVRVEFIV